MLAMQTNGGVCTPKGFKGAGIKAGIKASGNHDLAMLASDVPARCYAVFTINQVKAAPVLYDQEVLSRTDRISAIVINSGNANACTGPDGWADARRMAQLSESTLGLPKDSVLVCSTGIIGRKLPMEKLEEGIPLVQKELSYGSSEIFAKAIMTTDTRMKTLGAVLSTSAGEVRIGGACKGSGMIHPNMATMLGFITTDIELPATFQGEFKAWVNESFNAISVDGDMSTNDTCILLANGASGINYHDLSISEQGEFRRAIESVMRELALMIVRDGEGATRMVEIRVEKAVSKEDARKIGRFVCTSNLVKTAMFGQDPNWGRILSSAGSAGGDLVADRTDLFFEDLQVLRGGRPLDVDYTKLREVVARKEYRITLVLNLGDASASSYTCDLSYDYVKINAEYTT
jgi:glutamate N-acetyltransferase / amino-acid N-acetyltransferase